MANLAINALTAKTPVSTDLIPIADPTTGIAGKSIISQVISATSEDLVYTYSGTEYAPIRYAKTVPQWYETAYPASGCYVSYLNFAGSFFLTALELTNLRFVFNNLDLNSFQSLATLSLPALSVCGNNFSPNSLSLLTNLSVPSLVSVGGNFNPGTLASLTTLSVPSLVSVGGNFGPNAMASLTTLSIPVLVSVGLNFSPASMASLTTLSAPALVSVGLAFSPNAMGSLTTLSIPVLASVGTNFNPSNMALLTTLSAPALVSVNGSFNISSMASLTTVDLPLIQRIGATTGTGNIVQFNSVTANLSSFTFGPNLKQIGNGGGNVTFISCALNQASVDNILVRLAALDGTNGTTVFSNRTVTITGTSSTPSATGLAAKATLVARGCTVTNN